MPKKSVSEPVAMPPAESESEFEVLAPLFSGGKTEHFYVTVSNLKVSYVRDREEFVLDEHEWVGAVYIGELTREQHGFFERKFHAMYSGRYVADIQSRWPLPEHACSELKRLKEAHAILKGDQKKALDIALNLANQIRTADGCGDKNIDVGKTVAMVQADKPLDVRDEEVVAAIKETNALLKKQNSLIKENTAVTKKGLPPTEPPEHQSLAELVKTLPPLKYGREDENWVSLSTAATHTGETTDNLRKQRQRGENVFFEGLEYGRDTEKRIWFGMSQRKVFYLKKTLSALSRYISTSLKPVDLNIAFTSGPCFHPISIKHHPSSFNALKAGDRILR